MNSHKIILIITIIFVLVISGCYTQLMTPQDFVQSKNKRSTLSADASYQLNYNQNCLSCHSSVELNDRYFDLQYYNVMTVHNGIILEPRLWIAPSDPIILTRDPYGWYDPIPAQPWWNTPPATLTGSGQSSTSNEDGNRVRNNGSTRDKTGTRDRQPSNPTPVQATPQQPVGGTSNTTPAAPPPTTTVTTQPATQPAANTNSGERNRTNSDTNNNGNKTRNNGSSRDTSSDGRSR